MKETMQSAYKTKFVLLSQPPLPLKTVCIYGGTVWWS